ncbi:MAG: HEPN domain-containing protein [Caldisphaeraceae archaeon]|nr:HEPN domain-containing protein [Caldisphaeraceae archaeon]MEB3691812.1 HEPN domain-containing protein [Caldisphaeraceae archaeon]MEB3797544.1 HEPN domain-containing protein [Caldisphaeraceae archaeon]
MAKIEEFKYLIEKSRRFYESSIMQNERGFYDLVAFSLEQSLQLYLKAYILKLGADYPRTHSIRRLLDFIYELTKHNKIKDILQKYSVELALLEDVYITSRYIAREFRQEEVNRLRNVIDEVFKVVGEAVNRGGQA